MYNDFTKLKFMPKEPNKKLNIAMVCDPIGSNKSGVVVSTMRFAKLLTERGHHVIFIGARSKEHKGHSKHDGITAYRFRRLVSRLPDCERIEESFYR